MPRAGYYRFFSLPSFMEKKGTESLKIITDDWQEYELLDSGDCQKLERFGSYTIVRSEPRAWWKPDLPKEEWLKAVAVHEREGRGGWIFKRPIAREWVVNFEKLKFQLKLTNMSKHVGVFPEQAVHWRFVRDTIMSKGSNIKVLTIFGYTGAASIAAASAGASVTHVDGSKVSISWARSNQILSGLEAAPIRWIPDDAIKFVKREKKRGHRYDAIILDPPAFGRGPQGQLWKIEDDLVPLLAQCRQLLTDQPLFVILTMYSIEISALSAANMLADMTRGLNGFIEAGELVLKPKNSQKQLPMSIYGLWENQ